MLKSKSTLSNEKVEKVVKDPNTPMIKKYFIASEEKFLVSINDISNPMRKDPNMLTKSVLKNI